nr:MAG TPA: hypothetical protein [Caudoviricetes sp.]
MILWKPPKRNVKAECVIYQNIKFLIYFFKPLTVL